MRGDFYFFYQQWINKIKGDTPGVSQPIYSTQKWTSYTIHKRNSPLWLEQNNLKVRKPYPKNNQHRRPPITHMVNAVSSIGDPVGLWRTPHHQPAIMLIFAYLWRPPTTHIRGTPLQVATATTDYSHKGNAASLIGDHIDHRRFI